MPGLGELMQGPMPARVDSSRGRLVDGALLFLVPALFLYCGLFQRYPVPGWVDSGIYLGYFFDLPGLAARYGFNAITYHGTRLSWVLPGYWLHQAFAAALAQQLLVALLYFPAIGAAFLAGRGLGGRLGGHLAAAFIAYNPLFLAAVAFGAVDGAAISYLLAAAACLFAPRAGALSPARLIGFGALALAAGVAHPFALPLATLLALGYVLRDRPPAPLVLRQAALATAGAVLAFGVLALIGTHYGLRFWFPLDSVAMAERAVTGRIGSKYRIPLAEWLFGSYRLLIPCLLLAALLLAYRRAQPAQRRLLAAAAVIVGGSNILFLAFDVLVGGVTLQVRNYTNLALPACALALAALAGSPAAGHRFAWRAHMAVLLPALAVAACYAVRPDWLVAAPVQRTVYAALLLAGLAAAVAVARAADPRRAARGLVAFATVLLACGALNQDSANLFVARTGVKLKPAYLGASGLVEAIRGDAWLANRQLLFWYSREAFTTGRPAADRQLAFPLRFGEQEYRFTYYDTLSSLYLYDRSLLGDAFPQVDEEKFRSTLVQGGLEAAVVLLGQREEDLSLALATLAGRGLEGRVHARYSFGAQHFTYTAWVLEICGRNLPAGAQGRRCA